MCDSEIRPPAFDGFPMDRPIHFLIFAALFLPGLVHAGEPLPALVRQLGDSNFHKRIAAEQELLSRGVNGLSLASAGMQAADPEIQQRSQRLLSVLHRIAFRDQRDQIRENPWTVGPELAPGWETYQSLVGDSQPARNLYVQMIEQEPELMLAVSLQPATWPLLFERRCADLRTFIDRRATRELQNASVATLLFLSIHPDNRLSPLASATVAALIGETEFHSAVQRAGSGETLVYRALLSHWVESTGHSSAPSRLQLAARFQLPAGVAAAREIISGRRSAGQSRTQLYNAIAFLARYGDQKVIPDLESLLVLDQMNLNSLREKPSEEKTGGEDPDQATTPADLAISDLALLALLKVTGQDPQTYLFSDSRLDSEQRFSSRSPGFSTEGERRKALEKWIAWRNLNAPSLRPDPIEASEGTGA
jgi:hypothetical protein